MFFPPLTSCQDLSTSVSISSTKVYGSRRLQVAPRVFFLQISVSRGTKRSTNKKPQKPEVRETQTRIKNCSLWGGPQAPPPQPPLHRRSQPRGLAAPAAELRHELGDTGGFAFFSSFPGQPQAPRGAGTPGDLSPSTRSGLGQPRTGGASLMGTTLGPAPSPPDTRALLGPDGLSCSRPSTAFPSKTGTAQQSLRLPPSRWGNPIFVSFMAFLGPAHSLPQGHQVKELLVSSGQLGQGWEAQSRAELAQGGDGTETLRPGYGAAPLPGAEASGVHGRANDAHVQVVYLREITQDVGWCRASGAALPKQSSACRRRVGPAARCWDHRAGDGTFTCVRQGCDHLLDQDVKL